MLTIWCSKERQKQIEYVCRPTLYGYNKLNNHGMYTLTDHHNRRITDIHRRYTFLTTCIIVYTLCYTALRYKSYTKHLFVILCFMLVMILCKIIGLTSPSISTWLWALTKRLFRFRFHTHQVVQQKHLHVKLICIDPNLKIKAVLPKG